MPTIEIVHRVNGHYSLVLHRHEQPSSIVRAGIRDHDEARRRAKVWHDLLGYPVKDCHD